MPIKMTGSVRPTRLNSPDPISMPIINKLPALKAKVIDIRDNGPGVPGPGVPAGVQVKTITITISTSLRYGGLTSVRFFDTNDEQVDTQYDNKTTDTRTQFESPAMTITATNTYANNGYYYVGNLVHSATRGDDYIIGDDQLTTYPQHSWVQAGINPTGQATVTFDFVNPVALSKIDFFDSLLPDYSYSTNGPITTNFYDASNNLLHTEYMGNHTPVSADGVTRIIYDNLQAGLSS